MRGVKLTTHLHPVPTLRMSGAIPLLPHVYLNGVEGYNLNTSIWGK